MNLAAPSNPINQTDNNQVQQLADIREQIRQLTHADEDQCVQQLVDHTPLNQSQRQAVSERAKALVQSCRDNSQHRSLLDAFLQEFGLSNQEGIALMCMAEALLRIPDANTANRLIQEKLQSGDWKSHLGQSDSLFVNSSTWGLLFTGRFIELDKGIAANPVSWIKTLVHRTGEPVVRKAIQQAMKLMGGQYVLGRSIDEAIKRGTKENPKGTLFSFDMLGEGARTAQQAEQYFLAYLRAIEAIGGNHIGGHPQSNHGISVKLSALHPHYDYAHHQQVIDELLPRLTQLAMAAKQNQLGFTIDAEESERLDISLDLIFALANHPRLANWDGLGIVVQAYQKRASAVIDWLAVLAQSTGRCIMVRLVKGAYWDREIKFAQQQGHSDFPVFTRKHATELSYQHCVAKLFAAAPHLFPQFATHNAHTTALVLEMAGKHAYEFQRLHGMGGLLYQQLLQNLSDNAQGSQAPLRVYAPVGSHRDLLPYLVRRLLENGANSSFVNQFLDPSVPIDQLVTDPLQALLDVNNEFTNSEINCAAAEKADGKFRYLFRHPGIARPCALYHSASDHRNNAIGVDLNNPLRVVQLEQSINSSTQTQTATPIINGKTITDTAPNKVIAPANNQREIGQCYFTPDDSIDSVFSLAAQAQPGWDRLGGNRRAEILEAMADLMEEQTDQLIALISLEAGRTLVDAVDEVREAVDFCRYYALKARQHFSAAQVLPGPAGEDNHLSLHGRGVFVCISPWNFPLAIFIGQVAAALAAGNSVIAKPAEQTSIIASRAIALFLQAGVPQAVLHLVTGIGSALGPRLMQHPLLAGVAFTGSTATAKRINRQLADRDGAIIPLIAETGGQNAMIVDSSALPEQVVDDVISSAFFSAGQRCSALRVLYLQQDIAEPFIEMIAGAMAALTLGDPQLLSTDIGPVIDHAALTRLQDHIIAVERGDLNSDGRLAKVIARYPAERVPTSGHFFAPTMIELNSIAQLPGEVFGPILHIIRYKAKNLDKVIKDINASGYGLTLGVHSRIDATAMHIHQYCNVGNTYVNRNMVGAVVGTQPFGGCGLSGTGPKAGGPHYLQRFAMERTLTVNTMASGGSTELLALG